MSKIFLSYNGDLRCNLTHKKSNTSIITDAPTDNKGKGESFSPTDLVASALPACMMTIIGIKESKENYGILNAEAEIEKVMDSSPRRIKTAHIKMTIHTGTELTSAQKESIYETARNCPVALSLHPDLIQDLTIHFTH